MILQALLAACVSTVVHERVGEPVGWEKGAVVEGEKQLEFVFALKHTESAKEWLRNVVAEVSDPSHPRYGKHVTLLDVKGRMAVHPDLMDEVVYSLIKRGVADIEVLPSADFIRAKMTATQAHGYFNTKMCYWTAATSTRVIRSCDLSYHLTEATSRVVDFVSGLVHFPTPHAPRTLATATNDVAQLRITYNAQAAAPRGGNATVAFTQFLGEKYNPTDLATFIKAFTPAQEGQKIAHSVGGIATGHGVEAELDSQYLLAMGAGIETWAWTNMNENPVNNQEPWVEFFTNISASSDVPNLFSVSYGEGESTLTAAYIQRSDVELQKIAARGITVLASSGDNGAGCTSGKYVANFPASLPHITSVGATGECSPDASVAGFSSGGFSDSYPRQAWQAAAVEGYLSQTSILPDPKYYNASGRGYPDVAACGSVTICVDGSFTGVEGTSCSCPIFSGLLGLIIDARLAAGKPPLGFVAPALYAAHAANSASFHDVTTGSSMGGCDKPQGWAASPGWDPVTGLGTPNYAVLLQQLL